MARQSYKAALSNQVASATPESSIDGSYLLIEMDSWSEFKHGFLSAIGGSDYDNYKRFLFRGQGDANWTLTSSFDRAFSTKRAGSREQLAHELVREFYEECSRFTAWRYDINDPRVLAMAQHHGLPTRLLDWSFSPYVAAYFAFSWHVFEKKDFGGKIAVWALNREKLQESAPAGQLEIISVPDADNSRMGNQFGVFTYLKTNDASLEEYLTSKAVRLGYCLFKIEIPSSEYKTALQDLILMGIHHGTIFPGREGIAHTIKLRNLLSF